MNHQPVKCIFKTKKTKDLTLYIEPETNDIGGVYETNIEEYCRAIHALMQKYMSASGKIKETNPINIANTLQIESLIMFHTFEQTQGTQPVATTYDKAQLMADIIMYHTYYKNHQPVIDTYYYDDVLTSDGRMTQEILASYQKPESATCICCDTPHALNNFIYIHKKHTNNGEPVILCHECYEAYYPE